MNRIILIGRLVRDPDAPRVAQSTGNAVVSFTIAVDKKIKPRNPDEPSADFFRCSAWGKTGEFVGNYLTKGRLVAVEGRIEMRKYVDKEGVTRESWDVTCDNVQGLDRPRDDQGGGYGGDRGGYQNRDSGYEPADEPREPRESRPEPRAESRPAPRPAETQPTEDEYDPFADN